MSKGMTHPPQMVLDWIDLAVRYVEAGGVGCRECRGGIPQDAEKRGHNKHPKNCMADLSRCFAAYDMRTFLTLPAEVWYGMPAVPEDFAAGDVEGDHE